MTYFSTIRWAIVALIFIFLPGTAHAVNLVVDGDMEADGVAEWRHYGTPDSFTKNTTTVFSGEQSLRVVTNISNVGAGVQKFELDTSPVNIELGKPYLYRFRYNLIAGQMRTWTGIKTSNNSFDGVLGIDSTDGQGWQLYEKEFTVPDDGTYDVNENGFVDDFRVIIVVRLGDLYIDDVEIVEKNTVSLSSPVTQQVLQRNGNNQADIAISGSYTGTPDSIEAQFNNGDWQTIDENPADGTFSGNLLAQSVGQGSLTVRFTNDQSASSTTSSVSIGDIFVITGGTEAEGSLQGNYQVDHATLNASVFREDGNWANMNDVSFDSDTNDTVFWPLVADQLMDATNIPVGFISAADAGTTMTRTGEWQANAAATTAMLQQVTDAGGSVAAILWQNGSDELVANVDRAAHTNNLVAFATSLRNTLGAIPVFVAEQLYENNAAVTDLRRAQHSAWEDDSVSVGPTLYDLALTDANATSIATRWANRIVDELYDGDDSIGPVLNSAVSESGSSQLTLSFTDRALPLQSLDIDGFSVSDTQGTVLVRVADADNNTVTVTLDQALVGDATISLGIGTTTPALRDANGTPASFVYEFAITTSQPASSGGGGGGGSVFFLDSQTEEEEAPADGVGGSPIVIPTPMPTPSTNTPATTTVDPIVEEVEEPEEVTVEPSSCLVPANTIYQAIEDQSYWFVTPSCETKRFMTGDHLRSYLPDGTAYLSSIIILNQLPKAEVPFMPLGPHATLPDGSLVKTTDSPKVYLLIQEKRYWIYNEPVYYLLFEDFSAVIDVSQELLDQYEDAGQIG